MCGMHLRAWAAHAFRDVPECAHTPATSGRGCCTTPQHLGRPCWETRTGVPLKHCSHAACLGPYRGHAYALGGPRHSRAMASSEVYDSGHVSHPRRGAGRHAGRHRGRRAHMAMQAVDGLKKKPTCIAPRRVQNSGHASRRNDGHACTRGDSEAEAPTWQIQQRIASTYDDIRGTR